MLLFCDIETTGLDPDKDKLLEVGLAAVDADLNIVEQTSMVISLDLIPDDTADVVVDMHSKSGLWDECKHRGLPLRTVENRLFTWVFDNGFKGSVLVGNTIGFDRSFLRVHMPRLHDLFHYRSLDISSIRIADDMWADEAYSTVPADRKKHRVKSDILDSLDQLRHYKKKLWK